MIASSPHSANSPEFIVGDAVAKPRSEICSSGEIGKKGEIGLYTEAKPFDDVGEMVETDTMSGS